MSELSQESYMQILKSGASAGKEQIIWLIEDELTRLSNIVDKDEYVDIPRIQFAMQILINLLNEIKGENK